MGQSRAERIKEYLDLIEPNSILESMEQFQEEATSWIEESPSHSAEHAELTRESMNLLYQGEADKVSEAGLDIIEAIILPRKRPVVDIIEDDYQEVVAPWRHLEAEKYTGRKYGEIITPTIPSIGRINLPHDYRNYAGTGFVVGPNLLITNRHVARHFASGAGTHITFESSKDPHIDFKQELRRTQPIPITITNVLMLHPHWDIALLQVTGLKDKHKPLPLMANSPTQLKDREIAVIGYPARDERPQSNPALQDEVFRGIYKVKRMLPGTIIGEKDVKNSWGTTAKAITHNSSTLGGSSGSVVLDLETGHVLGIHFGGSYLKQNYAVPAWELARDPKVIDAGVQFDTDSSITTPAPWLQEWDKLLPPSSRPHNKTTPQTSLPTTRHIPRSKEQSYTELFQSGWYEWTEDCQIRDALQKDESGDIKAHLEQALGVQETQELIKDLQVNAHTEGLFGPTVNPELPEIVYLHGIMGGNLVNMLSGGTKIWFSALSFLRGGVIQKLRLHPNGLTDLRDDMYIHPMGHLWFYYSKAARKWRNEGYKVHEFSFDWRKPIRHCAQQLKIFIDQLVEKQPDRRLVLVAHSMGGVVSATYASIDPTWNNNIEQAILVGSPLGGSFVPLEAVRGTYPFFDTLSRLSRESIGQLQAGAVTMPGMLDMLPNPSIFQSALPDSSSIYTRSTWLAPRNTPDIDPNALVAPSQRWLDNSYHLKQQIANSPLLPYTTAIVAEEFRTTDSAYIDAQGILTGGSRTGPGDGTVPIMSSSLPQLRALFLSKGYRHGDLMSNPDVISAVDELLRNGSIHSLDAYSYEQAQNAPELPEKEDPHIPENIEGNLRQRFETGRLTPNDMAWILDPARGTMPN